MPVFNEVIDAEGNKTYVEAELGKLDIREHPEFQKVLKEQIASRQKASKLSAELKALETPSGEPEAKPETGKVVAPVVAPPTAEVVADLVEKRLAEKIARQQADKVVQDTAITNALSKHGLPPSARSFLEETGNPDVLAEKLAKSGLSFANSPAGGDTQTDTEALFAKIDKRLGLGKD